MATAIKVENLSKAYQLGEIGTGTLSRDLERWFAKIRGKEDPFLKIGETNDRTSKGGSDVVWSLKDVNFEIEQGDAVGIIGRNGAGKSTLLKLLSRVTSPTTGNIKVKGRIASLLEVGTGFHPELTGKENIYLNGAILGMRKKEIARKFDEIVEFAGVERYVDTPVKRYSSGMYVRLAFAVAAHLESEILIVDEVLAVGDAEFQKKCLGKMGEVSRGEGRTVLFVSHNISAVRDLCSRGLYLRNGKLLLSGNVNEVISEYIGNIQGSHEWRGSNGAEGIIIRRTYVNRVENKEPNISNSSVFYNKDELEVGVELTITKKLVEFGAGFILKSGEGNPIVRCFFNDYNECDNLEEGSYLITYEIPAYTLASGRYIVEFDISVPNIAKVNDDSISLVFEVNALDKIGDRYNNQNTPTFNSIIRPNWFKNIQSAHI